MLLQAFYLKRLGFLRSKNNSTWRTKGSFAFKKRSNWCSKGSYAHKVFYLEN